MASLSNVGTSTFQTNVRVVCRVRPMDEREKKTGTVPAASASSERREVAVARKVGGARQVRSCFHFDEVLGSFCTQEDVFATTLQPLVGQVLAGFEATAFAYGQTGTGKTYTMEGDADSEERRGLMPRAVAAVLDALKSKEYVDHSVMVSYLEIYNEELSDLLSPGHGQQKLQLMDSCDSRGTCCVGLTEVRVSSLSDVQDLVKTAQERKRIAETRVHARSSRSHCIFTMKVACRRRVAAGELENVGKLHLIDLAGSECAKKAAWSNEEAGPKPALEQERERRNINQSLLTLGRVIAALRERTGRVPYRDSKLTRLLRDALGGSCKTVVIATISPALSAVDETISTLTYAEQAAGITNRPVASSLLRSRSGEVLGSGSGSCSGSGATSTEWAEMEMKVAYLQQEVEEAQTALARKYQENQELLERVEKSEAALDEARSALQESEEERRRLTDTAKEVSQDLQLTARDLTSSAAREAESLAALAEHRKSEEHIVELLKVQREALEAEVGRVQNLLLGARRDLDATRAEAKNLQSSKAQELDQLAEEFAAFARTRLAAVGRGLEHSGGVLCKLVDSAQSQSQAAGEYVAAALASTTSTGEKVQHTAAEWQQEVASSCKTIQQQAQEASQVAEGRLTAAVQRFAGMEPRTPERRSSPKAATKVVDNSHAKEGLERSPPIYEDRPLHQQSMPDLKVKAKGHISDQTLPALPIAWTAPAAKENCQVPRVATPRGGGLSARRAETKPGHAGGHEKGSHEKAGSRLMRTPSGDLQAARGTLREVN